MGDVTQFISAIEKEPWDSQGICKNIRKLKTKKRKINKSEQVDIIVQIAIREDESVFSELKEHYPFELDMSNAAAETALHRLILHPQINQDNLFKGIIFLLQKGASFAAVNSTGKTPFHLLHEYTAPETLSAFWENEIIWNFIRVHQGKFDIPDGTGKSPVHYLMARKPSEVLNRLIKKYYRFRDVTSPDFEGNTPLHYACESGDLKRVSICAKILDENYLAEKCFGFRNKKNQTPADIAQNKGHMEIAAMAYQKEFAYSRFYNYIEFFFKKKRTSISSIELVNTYKRKILEEIKRLSRIIKIPSSELDDTIQEILAKLGIEAEEVFEGYELPVHGVALEQIDVHGARTLYELSPIGEVERLLREQVQRQLVDFVRSDDRYGMLQQQKEAHNQRYEADWNDYNEEMGDFEDGDYGYDYEGPIRPSTPEIEPFDSEEERKRLDEEFSEEVLEDIGELLQKITMSEGVLEQILYDHFIMLDAIDDIVKQIDFQKLGLDPVVAKTVLRNIDYQFYDIDITKPGFLVEVFRKNLKDCLEEIFYKYEIKQIVNEVFASLANNAFLINVIREFNDAENDLTTQQSWITLHSVVDLIYSKVQEENQERLATLEKEVEESKKKAAQKNTASLMKVFPTDNSDKLTFKLPGSRGMIHLPLRPIFKSLYSVAKATYDCIVEAAKNNENIKKTNIVTGMLSFVVSISSSRTNQHSHMFINVPLQLDYPSILLSLDPKDGVFKDDDEFQQMIASDRHLGGEVTGKNSRANVASNLKEAKKAMRRLLNTLAMTEEERKLIQETLERASAEKPLALEYWMKKDEQKKFDFHHSERVILHALKQEKNITKILKYLENEASKRAVGLGVVEPTFRICSVSLILYSYPNSVCDECSLGLIALKNSHEEGFLKTLIDITNQPNSVFKVQGSEMDLEVIVASDKIFANDISGNLIRGKFEAKLDFEGLDRSLLQEKSIVVGNCMNTRKSFLYEFVESNVHESSTGVPFHGHVAMSGSKIGKLGTGSSELPLRKRIDEYNNSLSMPDQSSPLTAGPSTKNYLPDWEERKKGKGKHKVPQSENIIELESKTGSSSTAYKRVES